jgi:hypothetical protein
LLKTSFLIIKENLMLRNIGDMFRFESHYMSYGFDAEVRKTCIGVVCGK